MNIEKMLRENGIKPKKKLDQFFVIDDRIIEQEIKLALLKSTDVVLEIGAGPGNVTEKISKKAKVIAIEKDYSFHSLLKNIPNTNVLFGDALEILENLRNSAAAGKSPAFNKVISNIPYSITQNIIIELLRHKWEIAVLIIPRDVAKKLRENEKLAIIVNECCETKIYNTVRASAFYPKAVDSSIVVLKQKKLMDYDFWQFLADAMKNRNKDVKKLFKNAPVKTANKKIHQLNVDELRHIFEINKVG